MEVSSLIAEMVLRLAGDPPSGAGCTNSPGDGSKKGDYLKAVLSVWWVFFTPLPFVF